MKTLSGDFVSVQGKPFAFAHFRTYDDTKKAYSALAQLGWKLSPLEKVRFVTFASSLHEDVYGLAALRGSILRCTERE